MESLQNYDWTTYLVTCIAATESYAPRVVHCPGLGFFAGAFNQALTFSIPRETTEDYRKIQTKYFWTLICYAQWGREVSWWVNDTVI